MTVELKHNTQAVGPEAGNGEVGLTEWNENHNLTGAANQVLGFDGSGDAEEKAPGTLGLVVTDVGTSITVTRGNHYRITADSLTLTLPLSPAAGDTIGFSSGSSITTTIARNGELINGVAEDITFDAANAYIELRYMGATGWRIIIASSNQSFVNIETSHTSIDSGTSLPDPSGYAEGSVFLVTSS